MHKQKNHVVIDIRLLKQNFPELIGFASQLEKNTYCSKGIPPVEVAIPREFFLGCTPRISSACTCRKIGSCSSQLNFSLGDETERLDYGDTYQGVVKTQEQECPSCQRKKTRSNPGISQELFPGQLEMIKRVGRAFKLLGYSFYQQYRFYDAQLGVESLFELREFDLKRLLLFLAEPRSQ